MSEEKPVVMQDFSGGITTDTELGPLNTLLQAENIILNPGGPFEKRKGSIPISSAGISVNSASDIYGVVWYAYYTAGDCWSVGYAFESTKGDLDTIILINYGDDNFVEAEAAYDAWVAAATAGGYIDSYTCAFANDCVGDPS